MVLRSLGALKCQRRVTGTGVAVADVTQRGREAGVFGQVRFQRTKGQRSGKLPAGPRYPVLGMSWLRLGSLNCTFRPRASADIFSWEFVFLSLVYFWQNS